MTKETFLSRCQDGLQYVQSGHQSSEQVMIVIQEMLDDILQKLQQDPCSTLRKKIFQELNREQQLYRPDRMNAQQLMLCDRKIKTLDWVLSLIDDMQPVA
jgi:hypothetical protein